MIEPGFSRASVSRLANVGASDLVVLVYIIIMSVCLYVFGLAE